MYRDAGSKPWELDKAWEDMSTEEWEEVSLLPVGRFLDLGALSMSIQLKIRKNSPIRVRDLLDI
jgi:hypothetical protein